jgi:hypothetical protein
MFKREKGCFISSAGFGVPLITDDFRIISSCLINKSAMQDFKHRIFLPTHSLHRGHNGCYNEHGSKDHHNPVGKIVDVKEEGDVSGEDKDPSLPANTICLPPALAISTIIVTFFRALFIFLVILGTLELRRCQISLIFYLI